jgi:DNA-binding SARP family transcriptional activator
LELWPMGVDEHHRTAHGCPGSGPSAADASSDRGDQALSQSQCRLTGRVVCLGSAWRKCGFGPISDGCRVIWCLDWSGISEMNVQFGRVKALGRPEVWVGSERVSSKAWGSRRAMEIFLLLIHYPAGLTKDQIVSRLFPEAEHDRGEGLFHTTLYRCRQALGNGVVIWQDLAYRIDDPSRWGYDVADFEALVRRARATRDRAADPDSEYRDAIQLYTGDYLAGFDSDWCEPIRVRLQRLYVEALVAVASGCASRGQVHSAVDLYRQAIEKDHYCEPAHRGLVQSLLAVGDRLAAVRHYRELVERLTDDFEDSATYSVPELAEDLLDWSPECLLPPQDNAPPGPSKPIRLTSSKNMRRVGRKDARA